MLPALKYAWLTLKHKWFVLVAGVRVGAPLWRLLIHDLSKFGPWELRQYGKQFFGDNVDPAEFAQAWLHHQNSNPHHWEYWLTRPSGNPLPIPEPLIREMFADWLASSRAYEGTWPTLNGWKWWNDNFEKILLHPSTRYTLVRIHREYFKEII